MKPSDITDFCRDAQHADKGMKESVATTDFIPQNREDVRGQLRNVAVLSRSNMHGYAW